METVNVPYATRLQVRRRRFIFFTVVFVLTSICSWYMADILWRNGRTHSGLVLWALFAVLTLIVVFGFCQAMFGFSLLTRGGDRRRITATLPADGQVPLASTAIVIPVFNEDVSRVFEGIRAIFSSVQATGQQAHFDIFICSDSNNPSNWIQEEVAWLELCKQLNAFGKIFYSKRRQALNRKSGNVSDFLRRWGKRYRYMVVLDADSIMTGDTLVKMVQIMEKNPKVGILQTSPQLVNAESLFGRIQQFGSRLYGAVFSAGLNYWQMTEGNYWGHNAIIRVQPFMEHCGLPELPGKEPFGGHILSHDYVEAALMRRAGYHVWLAYDLPGSYEEGPPTLIDAAKRDRRWCQGNMQHTWLLQAKGLHFINRLHLALGIMAYASSPLWLVFLFVSTLHVFELQSQPGPYYSTAASMWTPWGLNEAVFLFTLVMLFLFLPKIAAVAWTLGDRERTKGFGGPVLMVFSAVAETLISALLAPVQMLFHSKFVLYTLFGQGVKWITQNRSAADGTDWREAILTHWPHMLVGMVWGVLAWLLSPMFFWWITPVLIGLLFAVPLSIFLSTEQNGKTAREWGLFLVPEETRPPTEIARLRQRLETCYRHIKPHPELAQDHGLLQAVLDPYVNSAHVSFLRQRRKQGSYESREHYAHLREKLLFQGPRKLSMRDKYAVMFDAESMVWLHRNLWATPDAQLPEWWRIAMRQYNTLTREPATALYR